MQSPVKRTGWPGAVESSMDAPRTVERKRKARNVDVMGILPTPPQSRTRVQPPTPETARRSSRRTAKTQGPEASSSLLPTPETLPRHRRKHDQTTDEPKSGNSPSGHTTFFLSATSSARPEGVVRRRPGLTFAQQMGLMSQNPATTTTSAIFGGRLGVGIGMGGVRTNGHGKVDQITYGKLADPIPLENPFLDSRPIGLVSPGAMTIHQPGVDQDLDDNESMPSPLKFHAPPTQLESSLLSSPPTRKTKRIRTPPRATTEGQRKTNEMRNMMDAESNPFLSQPGEIIRPGRAGLVVDESRPTVTYVFRGTKKIFANPFFGHDQRFLAAELDPEDEDFEPHPCPPPKLLWPSGPSRGRQDGGSSREQTPPRSPVATPRFSKRGRRANMDGDGNGDVDVSGTKHAFTDEEFGSESEDDQELPARRGLLFASGGGIKRTLHGGDQNQGKKAKGRRF